MIYFSEIHNKQVISEDGIKVGTLDDLIFLATANPIVTKLVVRIQSGQKIIISTDYLQKVNHKVIIKKEYLASYLEENELYLVKNLLDKQIIDIKGNKIIRVNDVIINDDEKLSISGVDVGFLGVIRRLRIGGDSIYRLLRILNIKLTSKFLSWADIQPLELIRGKVKLKKKEEKLEKIRPEDLADYLEKTNVLNARKFLKILDTEKAAEVISNLNINFQTSLFKHFRSDKAARFISFIDPDEAVDVLLTLGKKKREEIIALLEPYIKNQIERLLSFSVSPIGGLITTEYLTIDSEDTAHSAIDKISKDSINFSSLDYIYITNKKDELVGVINLHGLLLQSEDTPIYKFMTQNVIVAHLTTPVEIVIKKMFKYKLYALPVVDENKHIQGIITLDDVNDTILKKV